MVKKNVRQLKKAELKKRKKKVTIWLGLLLLANACFVLFIIVIFLTPIDISLLILLPIFFVLFILAVSINLMRVSIDQELASRD